MIEDWKPRKTTKRIPYGYRLSTDPQVMEPDPEVIGFLDDALNSLDAGISLREACDTLNVRVPSLSLSHMGLRKIWNRERPNHQQQKSHPKPTKERMTRQARSQYRKKIKLASEKKSLAAIKKRIEKQQAELSGIQKAEEQKIEELTAPVVIRTEIEDVQIEREQIRPHPGPQTEFLSADEQEVLYGGAAGGGKSFAMLLDPLRHVDNPQFFGVILRRTTDELRKLVNESQFLYKKLYGKKIRWLEQKSKWVFPSGAELWMTYSDNERDLDRFQGQEYSWVGIDELTHYPTPETWNYLRTRLRSTVETGLPTYMRATTNPGGPGHYWVKKMFIDPAPPNTPFVARNEEDEEMFIPEGDPGFPADMWGKPMFYRRFIPAKLSDNPSLGWQYRANLMMQKEDTRRKLLDGDWSIAEGAAFPEFRLDTHTCRPFEIPRNWLRFKSADWGYSQRQASAVHWYAVDPNWGTLYVYRELYINQLTGSQLQQRINQIEHDAGDSTSYAVLDSSTWAVRGQTGPTIAEEMNRAGGRWRPSDRSQGSRVASKNRLHELLRVDPETGKPGIIFFDTCRRIIADLPSIPSAPPEQRDQDDIDQKYPNDHSYDSIRYGIQSRPRGEFGWDSWQNQTPVSRPADRVFGY